MSLTIKSVLFTVLFSQLAASASVAKVCFDLILPQCQGYGYSKTTTPLAEQRGSANTKLSFYMLGSWQHYSEELIPFLCYTLAPECREEKISGRLKKLIELKPCRSTCQHVRYQMNPLLKGIPSALDSNLDFDCTSDDFVADSDQNKGECISTGELRDVTHHNTRGPNTPVVQPLTSINFNNQYSLQQLQSLEDSINQLSSLLMRLTSDTFKLPDFLSSGTTPVSGAVSGISGSTGEDWYALGWGSSTIDSVVVEEKKSSGTTTPPAPEECEEEVSIIGSESGSGSGSGDQIDDDDDDSVSVISATTEDWYDWELGWSSTIDSLSNNS